MTVMDKSKEKRLRQYHIDLQEGDVGEYVLLPGDPARVELFASLVDEPRKMAYKREYQTYTGTYRGIKVSCTSTGIGCPSTAIAVEELARVGARTFIRIGSCAALQENIHSTDLIIPTGAMRNEGTTPFYAPLELPAVPDFGLTRALVDAADDLAASMGFKVHTGIIGSDDAFYGETPEFIERMNRLGLKGVDMESAAIYIICHLRGLRGATVNSVSANTFTGEGLDETAEPLSRFEPVVRVALEAIYRIHTQAGRS